VWCRVWWSSPLRAVGSAGVGLDEVERRRCERLVRADDRARFVAGRLLARRAVAGELGCAPGDVRIVQRCAVCGGAHGKPRVAGHAGLGLSIAHAGEHVVVAVARGRDVGIDVERVGPYEDLAGRDAGVLHDAERAVLAALAPAERARAFCSYWTRKEALLKASGEGLTVELATLHLTAPADAPAIVAGPPSLPPERVWMRDLDAGDGYGACVALLGPGDADVRVEQSRVDLALGA